MTRKKLSLQARSFIVSISIILALVIFSYVLTLIIPAGEYQRVLDANGNSIIYTDSSNPYGVFNSVTRDFPFWKFLLSPILVLGSDGNIMLIAILIFLLTINGVFTCLTKQNLIEYFLRKIVNKYYKKRYVLLFVLPLIFMALSTCAGCFEEYIPLIPIIVALSLALGWDNQTGLAMMLIAAACGYVSGIINPFGTGIAQEVAGVAAFSGIWLRCIVFVVMYAVLVLFLYITCRKYEKKHPYVVEENSLTYLKNPKYDSALLWFAIIAGLGILIIICSTFLTFLQDYTLIIFALCFLTGSIIACFKSGMKSKEFFKCFLKGVIEILPTILMILLASSIKYILTESKTIDPIIKSLLAISKNLSPYLLILFIYLIVLIMEFFVPSGSAKAFLLIPLLIPISSIMNISSNLVVLAYIFGDGLANVIYPTNPGLLISLNLANTNYGKYMKHNWLLFLILFMITCAFLMLGLAIGYK